MKSWNEIRKAATAFSKRWKNAYDEKAQALRKSPPLPPQKGGALPTIQ